MEYIDSLKTDLIYFLSAETLASFDGDSDAMALHAMERWGIVDDGTLEVAIPAAHTRNNKVVVVGEYDYQSVCNALGVKDGN